MLSPFPLFFRFQISKLCKYLSRFKVFYKNILKKKYSFKEFSPGGANSKHFVQITPYICDMRDAIFLFFG